MKTFLKGKGKFSHLNGTGPNEDNPKFPTWDEEDSMIMSWVWNSNSTKIACFYKQLKTSEKLFKETGCSNALD